MAKDDKSPKRLWGFFYSGVSIPIEGSKTESQVKEDRKYRRLSQGLILLVVLVIGFILVAQELIIYWFGLIRALFGGQ